jgi:Rne/Rng family ribonuclease
MTKEICISSTPHETRLAILEDDQLAEIYYERENEYTLAGSIYKGRVTRVLPGMQSAFVDLGLERDAFLYVTDFLEEQEDSADFEAAAPSGNGHSRRDNNQQREQRPRQEGGQRTESAPRAEVAPREEAPGESEDSDESESSSGTRRWRGRRGRRRGFRGRGPQDEQPARETQPSSSPSLESFEVVEEAIAAEPIARPERGAPGGVPAQHLPVLLPGESLSKYGASPAVESKKEPKPEPKSPSAAGINYFAPKPSTLIETPLAWDGGALLPGESISRHRRGEPVAAAPAPEPAAETEAAAEIQISAPVTEHLPTEEAATEPEISADPVVTEAPLPASEISSEPEAQVADAAESVAPSHIEEPTLVAHFESPAVEASHDEFHEEVHEFEPETASASYRVDPAAPSEFRVGAPVEEEFIASEEHPAEAQEPHSPAEVETPQPVSETVAAETPAAESDLPAEAHAHSVTTSEAEAVDHLYGYAPGLGVLEEEIIEEEEYDFEPIHAHSDEQEVEDLEEETLDQAADIGDAVRDAHLDQRLGLGSPAEDAPEEDESEEDELDESEEENGLGAGFAESENEDFYEEDAGHEEQEHAEVEAGSPEAAAPQRRESPREGGRRGDRRGGRGRNQGRRHSGGGGGRRPSAQTQDLPIISDLLKQGQEILVQIAKEPIARKGARITSHIALPGRFLVFMPTVNHVGVSRKISSDEERQRLKRILISEKGTEDGGFIVRTAADGTSEDDLRADIRFLLNLWKEIRQRAEEAKAPALIYHDLNLVERVLRDQVNDNFSTIWVDSEVDYERIVRFLNRFQPSLIRRVKLYTKETPLFEQFGIQEEIGKALKSKVWLKSGGSIVINQTEALVAIDINTGKYVGKTARLEDTILKTNLDAIPEIVRQIRLRDLGGIIVIDFIDMDERRNRHKVMQALEEELKSDRAPSKVLQFNDFGLVAITRKRVKQSLERTLSIPCPTCTATGMVKSPITVANEIYIEMRKMQKHFERGDVLLRVNPEVVKTLKASNARWLNELEEMTGKTIIVKSDPALHPEQFDIH